MIEEACTCDEGFGVPHSHVYGPVPVPCPLDPPCWMKHEKWGDTGEIKPWVDWKRVARA